MKISCRDFHHWLEDTLHWHLTRNLFFYFSSKTKEEVLDSKQDLFYSVSYTQHATQVRDSHDSHSKGTFVKNRSRPDHRAIHHYFILVFDSLFRNRKKDQFSTGNKEKCTVKVLNFHFHWRSISWLVIIKWHETQVIKQATCDSFTSLTASVHHSREIFHLFMRYKKEWDMCLLSFVLKTSLENRRDDQGWEDSFESTQAYHLLLFHQRYKERRSHVTCGNNEKNLHTINWQRTEYVTGNRDSV